MNYTFRRTTVCICIINSTYSLSWFVMIRTIATIIPIVSRNTRTTETIDQVGATSTVLAWIRTAFVDIYNTKVQS